MEIIEELKNKIFDILFDCEKTCAVIGNQNNSKKKSREWSDEMLTEIANTTIEIERSRIVEIVKNRINKLLEFHDKGLMDTIYLHGICRELEKLITSLEGKDG